MKNREYMFTNKHYTVGGIIATVFGVFAAVCLIWGLALAFYEEGKAGSIVGLIGAGALLCSFAGVIIGVRSFWKEEGFYTFSWIGSILSGIILFGMLLIVAAGTLL